jgi:hypothetical protein
MHKGPPGQFDILQLVFLFSSSCLNKVMEKFSFSSQKRVISNKYVVNCILKICEISELMGSDWPQLSDKIMYIHIYSHSQLLTTEMKVRIYKTLVKHNLMYGHKLWTLAQ